MDVRRFESGRAREPTSTDASTTGPGPARERTGGDQPVAAADIQQRLAFAKLCTIEDALAHIANAREHLVGGRAVEDGVDVDGSSSFTLALDAVLDGLAPPR